MKQIRTGPLTGRQIRALRQKLHLTQEQLAEQAGLSVRTLQRIEATRGVVLVRPASMRKLDGFFGTDPGGLAPGASPAGEPPVSDQDKRR